MTSLRVQASSSQHSPQGRSARNGWVVLAVMLAIASYLSFLVLRPFAGALLTGWVLAVVFLPLHRRIHGWVERPGLAAGLSTIVVVAVFGIPAVFVVMTLARELGDFYTQIAQRPQAGGVFDLLDRALEYVSSWSGLSPQQLRGEIGARIRDVAGALLRQGPAVIGVAASGVIQAIIIIGTLFMLFRDGKRLRRSFVSLIPMEPARMEELMRTGHEMILASFYGVLAVAMAQGLLCGLGVWIVGLPSPALWGLAGAAFSVLPIIGTAFVWVPAAVVLFTQGAVVKGLIMLGWGGLLVANVDNVVRPMVLASRVQINGLLVFLALLGGFEAFGMIGFFLGPLALAITGALLKFVRQEMNRQAAHVPGARSTH
jgi:predicted PurR-regulated permease PerM